jgi:DNA repair protein RadC
MAVTAVHNRGVRAAVAAVALHPRVMTHSTASYDPICAEVRARWSARTDGDLMLVFVDAEGVPLLTLDVDEGTRHLDELFLRHVTTLILDIGLPAVVLAVPRAAGRPTRVDRRLWRELTARLGGATTQLLDLLVVGDATWWSATLRRPAAATGAGAAA